MSFKEEKKRRKPVTDRDGYEKQEKKEQQVQNTQTLKSEGIARLQKKKLVLSKT